MLKPTKLLAALTSATLASCMISPALCSAAIAGDVSGNGEIDLYDAIIIAKYGMGMISFTQDQLEAADYNGDGIINLYDVIGIAVHLLETGNFTTGWVTENGKKYYYNSAGLKSTGLLTINGSIYYFGTDGAMRTGWQTVGSNKYYFSSSGAALTGWQTLSSEQYYFGNDGIMRTGTQIIDGAKYYFDDNGVYIPKLAEQSLAEEVLDLVNQERSKYGVAPLTLNQTMNAAAHERATEIYTLFSHTRPDNTSCFTIFDEYGLSWSYVAENIAYGVSTPEEVMDLWMNSSGHRANILSADVTELGVGYYDSHWVQIFRTP